VTIRRSLVLLAVIVMGLTACGDDVSDEATPAARPADLDDVRAVFADGLADLGLRLTDRGGVLERDGYVESSTGTHLALYVAPSGAYSDDEYTDGILATARLLGPEVLRRWAALESFDVCQEQPGTTTVDGEPDLAPYTQLDMTREQVEALDWDTLTLAELLAVASEQAGEGIRLYVADPIQASAAFVTARTEAGLSP
jgi:hypothetical protein